MRDFFLAFILPAIIIFAIVILALKLRNVAPWFDNALGWILETCWKLILLGAGTLYVYKLIFE